MSFLQRLKHTRWYCSSAERWNYRKTGNTQLPCSFSTTVELQQNYSRTAWSTCYFVPDQFGRLDVSDAAEQTPQLVLTHALRKVVHDQVGSGVFVLHHLLCEPVIVQFLHTWHHSSHHPLNVTWPPQQKHPRTSEILNQRKAGLDFKIVSGSCGWTVRTNAGKDVKHAGQENQD